VPEKAMTDAPRFALPDQSGARWTLADHLDAATVLVFYRGDW
jgi:peroxiredoxin